MTTRGTFVVGLLITAVAARADGPTSRPAVPDLVAGRGSFVVEGSIRVVKGSNGIGLAVAVDGAAERVAAFDLGDGTPIFLSDGRRTLVYDLTGNRVVLLSPSRGVVGVGWGAAEDQFTFTLDVATVPADKAAELADNVSFVRLAPFAGRAEVRDGGARLERVKRESIASLAPVDDGFRFTAGDPLAAPEVDVRACGVGRRVEPSRLAFPDVDRLRADGVAVEPLDGTLATLFIGSTVTGGGMGAKVAIAVGGPPRERAEHVAGGADALAQRDAELGGTYRAALAKQGITFGPATKPAQ